MDFYQKKNNKISLLAVKNKQRFLSLESALPPTMIKASRGKRPLREHFFFLSLLVESKKNHGEFEQQ